MSAQEEKKEEEAKLSELSKVDNEVVPETVKQVSDADGVVDTEKMVLERKEQGDTPVEKKFKLPKLFINKDERDEVDVEIVFSHNTGELFSISRHGLMNRTLLSDFGIADYTFKFSPVNYHQMQVYRKMASHFDTDAKEVVINRLQLRSYLLINHLKETNIPGRNGEVLKVELDPETNSLTAKTIEELYNTVPSLLEIVLSLFEKKMLLSFKE